MNQRFRTLLVLGRFSNLPTVWSNCLAGWWLGGGWNAWKLPWLLLGTSLIYCGGMFLHDAFDQEYDRLRRPERPIPSGKIPAAQVWNWGFGLLAAGVLASLVCGKVAGVAALLLAFFIILYDFAHKLFFLAAPWLMGACRFWVYIIAGATGINHADGYWLDGFPIFCGTALALYVAGLRYVALRNRFRHPLYWPIGLLVAPVALALVINTGTYLLPAIWISLVVMLWVVRYVSFLFLPGSANAGWIAENLLAGIVLVDWLAIAPLIPPWKSALVFVCLFGLTKWLQKVLPTT